LDFWGNDVDTQDEALLLIRKGAVAEEWDSIRSEEDKDLLAPSNSNFSPDERKGYQALARLRKRII
jgi:hypothetical protein